MTSTLCGFVNTFKRDVYVNARPDALSIMRQLADWFDDYNEKPLTAA